MAKKKRVHKRVWLEPSNPDAMSYISYTKYPNSDGIDLEMTDCSRKIYWGFNGSKGLKKLDRTIKIMQDVRELLSEGIE